MIGRRRVLAGVVMTGALLLSGCGSTEKFRYKMTVEVDTPQGVKTGFAVREMRYRANGGFMFGEGRPQLQLMGEAVAVDVAPGKTLFALLTGQDGYVDYAGNGVSTIFRVMDSDGGQKGGPHEIWPKAPVIREPITDPVPMLVSFRDIKDPTSVERLAPDALDKAFGPGVRLKRITVQATDDDVTVGIGVRLSWLKFYYNRQLDGHRYNDSQNFSNSLNVLSLQQGAEQ
jgi:hypothetical protein